MFNVKSTVLEKRTGKMLNSVLGNYIRETGISCVTNSTYLQDFSCIDDCSNNQDAGLIKY